MGAGQQQWTSGSGRGRMHRLLDPLARISSDPAAALLRTRDARAGGAAWPKVFNRRRGDAAGNSWHGCARERERWKHLSIDQFFPHWAHPPAARKPLLPIVRSPTGPKLLSQRIALTRTPTTTPPPFLRPSSLHPAIALQRCVGLVAQVVAHTPLQPSPPQTLSLISAPRPAWYPLRQWKIQGGRGSCNTPPRQRAPSGPSTLSAR
jgi:hypothetical protein